MEDWVIGVDLGGNGSRALLVRPEGAALAWAAPHGTGAGLASLRELGDPMAVVRWLPHPLSWAEVWDRLSNVEVRPSGVPQSEEDWGLQEAAAREALAATWNGAQEAWATYAAEGQDTPGVDLMVGRGTVFSHARTPGQAALMLMDALQPTGVSRLALDWANLLPGLTGLAQLDPWAAVDVFDRDTLLELGALIAPGGLAKAGVEAVKARLVVQGETRAEVSVPAGSIRRLPLGVNERGRLELHLARGLDLGLGRRGRMAAIDVRGGALGVIIDARGRPLSLPMEESVRCQVIGTWQREIDEV